jgi:hypothetical protein
MAIQVRLLEYRRLLFVEVIAVFNNRVDMSFWVSFVTMATVLICPYTRHHKRMAARASSQATYHVCILSVVFRVILPHNVCDPFEILTIHRVRLIVFYNFELFCNYGLPNSFTFFSLKFEHSRLEGFSFGVHKCLLSETLFLYPLLVFVESLLFPSDLLSYFLRWTSSCLIPYPYVVRVRLSQVSIIYYSCRVQRIFGLPGRAAARSQRVLHFKVSDGNGPISLGQFRLFTFVFKWGKTCESVVETNSTLPFFVAL